MDHKRTAAAVENPGEYPEMGDYVDDWSTIRVGQPRHQATQATTYTVRVRHTKPGRLNPQSLECLSLAGTGDAGNNNEWGGRCVGAFSGFYLRFLASPGG